MPRRRVSGTGRKASKKTNKPLKCHRFAGLSIGGGKTLKTSVAILEYYPGQERVFLCRLYDKIKPTKSTSVDMEVYKILTNKEKKMESISFDAPLNLPKCIRCRLVCPGYEKCKEKEIKWMWSLHKSREKTKRPNKIFTPYTERCTEMYIASELEEPIHLSHALGANGAPLTARAHFLKRRIKAKIIETSPLVSVWRIGRHLKVAKSQLRHHRHSVRGEEARSVIIEAITSSGLIFIYDQDAKILIENNSAFEAFIGAVTGYLKFKGAVEKPPKNFPIRDGWIEIPKKDLGDVLL